MKTSQQAHIFIISFVSFFCLLTVLFTSEMHFGTIIRLCLVCNFYVGVLGRGKESDLDCTLDSGYLRHRLVRNSLKLKTRFTRNWDYNLHYIGVIEDLIKINFLATPYS